MIDINKLLFINKSLDLRYIYVIAYNLQYNVKDGFPFCWGRNIRINLLYHYFKGYNPIPIPIPKNNSKYINYTLSNRIYFICA